MKVGVIYKMLPINNPLVSLTEGHNTLTGRLLVVDDEQNSRSPLVYALSLYGYSVAEAASGVEALALLKHNSYDLILLDLYMPDFDGLELMRRTHQLDPHLLIIILTSYATLESAIAAVKLGAVDYLCKPTSISEIIEAVILSMQKRTKQVFQQQPVHLFSEIPDPFSRTETRPKPISPTTILPFSVNFNINALPKQVIQSHPLILDCQTGLITTEDNLLPPFYATRGEMAVLAGLMSYPRQILSCRQLVTLAWNDTVSQTEAKSIIRPYIFRLRRKLKSNPQTDNLIRTVRRRGYYFHSA